MRTPRIVLGDSPAVCLKYARHALARAKRAARMGDRKEAGRWWSEAGETGMLPIIDGPTVSDCQDWGAATVKQSRSLRQLQRAFTGHIGEV